MGIKICSTLAKLENTRPMKYSPTTPNPQTIGLWTVVSVYLHANFLSCGLRTTVAVHFTRKFVALYSEVPPYIFRPSGS